MFHLLYEYTGNICHPSFSRCTMGSTRLLKYKMFLQFGSSNSRKSVKIQSLFAIRQLTHEQVERILKYKKNNSENCDDTDTKKNIFLSNLFRFCVCSVLRGKSLTLINHN